MPMSVEAKREKGLARDKAYYEAHKEERRAASKAYYHAHPKQKTDEQKARKVITDKAHYDANPEYHKARGKAYCAAHKEERRAKRKVRHAANPEKSRAQSKAWREANPEKHQAKSKAYYHAHKEEMSASVKAYYEANPEKNRARHKVYQAAHREERNTYQREIDYLRRKADPRKYRVMRLRDVVKRGLRGRSKDVSTLEYLGFASAGDRDAWADLQEARSVKGQWHHSIPIEAYGENGERFWDLDDSKHQLMVSHHLNLQWLTEEQHKAQHRKRSGGLPENWEEIITAICNAGGER